ncbi:MAG: site-specific integrase [Clostridiales bacterium]|nr:site-specific integrase [Clostridiales bacterium]
MAKRGENIYLRKDGRWEGRYIKGRRPDRSPVYGSVYAHKYSECREKLLRAKACCLEPRRHTKACGSLAEFVNDWLHSVARPGVKASTYGNYCSIAENWLIPCLGQYQLDRLGRAEVQGFVNSLSEQGLSAGTVRNIFHVLFAAMKHAVAYGYLIESPCTGTVLPGMERREARLLSVREQKKLEQAARADKNGLPVLLAMYTGLRVGELCALRWSDVDLEHAVLRISQTRQRIKDPSPGAGAKTVLVTGSAKSRRSVRTIPLPACMAALLRAHRKTAPLCCESVFSYRGRPLEPRLLQYRFKALLKRAGLRDINFHALRHTFATRCMELCFDVKTLSELLGHASAKMTLDRYGHSQLEHKRRAMRNLDGLFAASA